jgi:AraC-like DNA-binding protein
MKGEVKVKTYEEDCISCHENEMLFMPRDIYLISDLLKKKGSVEVFLVFFDHDIVCRFLGSKIKQTRSTSVATLSVSKLNSNKKILHFFSSLKDIYFDFDNDKDILELKLLECLHLVYLTNQDKFINTLISSENQKKRRSIDSIITANYDKCLTIADFANLSGRSLSTFNRDFKRKYGQSPKQWLIKKKMEKAKKLMMAGSNVTNCAIEVGYSNVSNFIKAYKLFYGETPKVMAKTEFDRN